MNIDIEIKLESQDKKGLEQAMAMLQEKFPNWKFIRHDYFQLYRKDDPRPAEMKNPHYYRARVYLE